MAPCTGELGRLRGLPADGALGISGVWVGNGTEHWKGGVTGPSSTNALQAVFLESSLDLGKAIRLYALSLWTAYNSGKPGGAALNQDSSES